MKSKGLFNELMGCIDALLMSLKIFLQHQGNHYWPTKVDADNNYSQALTINIPKKSIKTWFKGSPSEPG